MLRASSILIGRHAQRPSSTSRLVYHSSIGTEIASLSAAELPSSNPTRHFSENRDKTGGFSSFFGKDNNRNSSSSNNSNSNKADNAADRGGFSSFIRKNAKPPSSSTTASSSNPSSRGDRFPSEDENVRSPPWSSRQKRQWQRNRRQQHQSEQQKGSRETNDVRSPTSTAKPSNENSSVLASSPPSNLGSGSNDTKKDAAEDLRDISALRETFMKPRESWRRAPSGSIPSFASWEDPTGTSTTSSDSSPADPAGATGGASWRPSFFRQTTSANRNSNGSNASYASNSNDGQGGGSNKSDRSNNTNSIEQVLKAHAQQRKLDMEQRFRNAGERVPYHMMDDFGNTRVGYSERNARGDGRGWRDNNHYRNNNNQGNYNQRGQHYPRDSSHSNKNYANQRQTYDQRNSNNNNNFNSNNNNNNNK